jgi:hypothetical protein
MRNEDERSDFCRSHTVLLFDFRRVLVLLWRDCATPPHETCVDRMACFAYDLMCVFCT